MILAKYFKLIFYLAICILGYSTGLYVGYKKLLNILIDYKNDTEHTVDKCYTYKKVMKPCIHAKKN